MNFALDNVMNIKVIKNRALSKKIAYVMLFCFPFSASAQHANPNNLPACPAELTSNWYSSISHWHNCFGKHNYGDKIKYKNSHRSKGYYQGEYRSGSPHGFGKSENYQTPYQQGSGNYVGQWSNGEPHGLGILTRSNDEPLEGIWNHGRFMEQLTITSLTHDNEMVNKSDNSANSKEAASNDMFDLALENRKHIQQQQSQRVNLRVTHTQPASDGSITINVQTNADTASLLINGEELGGRTSGHYIVKKFARAGQETKFIVTATDINGNKDTKVIAVTRQIVKSVVKYEQLNPAQVKKQPERDAVAIIIGITNYKSLDPAEFSNDDARAFYDYAMRGLGVKPENIKLLVDESAEEAEILKAFRTWLPARTKSTTDVYIFYSGHGYPTPDGNGLYLIPQRADREVIDDTAIPFSKINDLVNFTRPKSVTVILDACYSGQTKAGKTLTVNARPLSIKPQTSFFPANFTVISASQSDQISSSSPELQHGILSYYLMKGMEGEADTNKDGNITFGEMVNYLVDNVGRQAAMMSRKQEPQLLGDPSRILVGR
jgi:hypothetical protein